MTHKLSITPVDRGWRKPVLTPLCGGYGFRSNPMVEYTVVGKNKRGKKIGKYVCTRCKKTTQAAVAKIKIKSTTLCHSCTSKTNNLRHGLRHHPLYHLWVRMRQRCNNPTCSDWNYYGGRGIRVCKDWETSFANFHKWATSNNWSSGLTIERIDFNGNYTPSNCTWIPQAEQVTNMRKRNDNKSGYTGILFKHSWCWYISYKGKKVSKSGYRTKEAALQQRNEYIRINSLPHVIQPINK